jgi:hypothetical protein
VKRREPPVLAGGVPVELLDRDADLWSDQELYAQYMAARGWRLPSAARFGRAVSPAYRRRRALGAWAVEQGMTRGTLPDWSALKARGLL